MGGKGSSNVIFDIPVKLNCMFVILQVKVLQEKEGRSK